MANTQIETQSHYALRKINELEQNFITVQKKLQETLVNCWQKCLQQNKGDQQKIDICYKGYKQKLRPTIIHILEKSKQSRGKFAQCMKKKENRKQCTDTAVQIGVNSFQNAKQSLLNFVN